MKATQVHAAQEATQDMIDDMSKTFSEKTEVLTESLTQGAHKAVDQISASALNTLSKTKNLTRAGMSILNDASNVAVRRAKDYSKEATNYVSDRPAKSFLIFAGISFVLYLLFSGKSNTSSNKNHVRRYNE